MRRFLVVLCLIAAGLPVYVAAPARAQHDNLPGCAGTRISGYIDVAQGTPDATKLHYQVMLPKNDPDGDGRFAAVLDYSGYQPGLHIWDGLDDEFSCEGYAVIGLSMRGTGCSAGKFDYFEPRQAQDGREAIEWLAGQRWSNGRIAMVGKSYPGITQLFVAGQPGPGDTKVDTPDGLVAIVPGHVFGDLYRDVPYPGGIMNVTFAAGWSAGRIYEPFFAPYGDQSLKQGGPDPEEPWEWDPTEFEPDPSTMDRQCMVNAAEHTQNPPFNPFVRALSNQYDGALFKERSPWYWADNISVPTFLVEAWQDEQVGSRATELTERFAPDLTWRALFTNGDHGEYYGSDVLVRIKEFLRFYLAQEIPPRFQGGTVTEFVPKNKGKNGKGTYVTRPETFAEALARFEAEPRVQINWETGAGGGRVPAWTSRYEDWPIPQVKPWRLNLTPDGKLVETEAAPGEVTYTYRPGSSQQRGGYTLADEPEPVQASWEERPEPGTSAMFESEAFSTDKVLAGPASLDLTVSSTAADTDFQVTVTEVRPDGQEMFVQQGWLRASHRALDESQTTTLRPYQTHTVEDAQPLVPGEQVPVRIEVFPFAHAFRAGSKLRIYVEAPHVKPDLWGFAILPVPAQNTIYTGPGQSSIALPLIEGETAPTGYPGCTIRNQPCRPA